MTTVYEYLKALAAKEPEYIPEVDVYDINGYGNGAAWGFDFTDDNADSFSKVCEKIFQEVNVVGGTGNGSIWADIGSFVKNHYEIFYTYSQDFKWSMDQENLEEDNIDVGVKMVEAIILGYIPDEDYEWILNNIFGGN